MSKVIYLLPPRNEWMKDIHSHLIENSELSLARGKKPYLFNSVFKRWICSIKPRCSQYWRDKNKLYDLVFISQSCLQTTQTITRAGVSKWPKPVRQRRKRNPPVQAFWVLASPLSQCRLLVLGKCCNADRWRLGITSFVCSIQIVAILFQKMNIDSW